MVSKRNLFSIGIMMVVLLFLFQFSMVIKDNQNKYDVNENMIEKQEDGAYAWKMQTVSLKEEIPDDLEYTIFVGEESETMANIVTQWCNYTKRNLIIINSIEEYPKDIEKLPENIIFQSEKQAMEDMDRLQELAEKGVTIIFASLEDVLEISKNDTLKNFLGISTVASEETRVVGMKLFDGFLLGGEVTYQAKDKEEEKEKQDFNLNLPWYLLNSGTKVYMTGLFTKNSGIKDEQLPPVIWRNTVQKSSVFAVNGDYLQSAEGIGILEAMMLEASTYTIYPVVNAQNLSITNFPGFASENNETMEKMYSRNQIGVYRDLIWPGLVAVSDQNRLKMTCFVNPQFDYTDANEPDGDELIFYLKQFKEVDAEAGFSLAYIKGVSLADKVKRDGDFFASQNSNYRYGAAYANEAKLTGVLNMLKQPLLQSVGTIVCEYNEKRPILSYCDNSVTLQMATNHVLRHTYKSDLRMRSLQSVIAYTNAMLDMRDVVWPEENSDGWETIYETFASNLNTYWKIYSYFTPTTISESNERVRNFLNLDYTHNRTEQEIVLNTNKTGTWFILRTHGEEIEKIEGGIVSQLEDGAYLIQTEQEQVNICLKEQKLYYYLPE